jgi:hypothetical protein
MFRHGSPSTKRQLELELSWTNQHILIGSRQDVRHLVLLLRHDVQLCDLGVPIGGREGKEVEAGNALHGIAGTHADVQLIELQSDMGGCCTSSEQSVLGILVHYTLGLRVCYHNAAAWYEFTTNQRQHLARSARSNRPSTDQLLHWVGLLANSWRLCMPVCILLGHQLLCAVSGVLLVWHCNGGICILH